MHLVGLEVLWVGVRCDPVIAADREIARRPGGRHGGLAGRDRAPGCRLRPGGGHQPHRVPGLCPHDRRARRPMTIVCGHGNEGELADGG